MNDTIKEKSCGILTFRIRGGIREYLMLRYPEGHWDFPKGHVETGELEAETALRELLEETGIDEVKLVDGFKSGIDYFYTRKGQKFHKDVWFFIGETDTETIVLSHEHKGFKWLPFEKAIKAVTHKNAKELLRKAEDFLTM